MFRAYGPGPSLWETVLPPEALVMPAELSMVDALLDDPVFLEPFRPYFHPTAGRKSVSGGDVPPPHVLELPLPAPF